MSRPQTPPGRSSPMQTHSQNHVKPAGRPSLASAGRTKSLTIIEPVRANRSHKEPDRPGPFRAQTINTSTSILARQPSAPSSPITQDVNGLGSVSPDSSSPEERDLLSRTRSTERLWTSEMEERLAYVQAELTASQRRWSAGQEKWIQETEYLLELRRKHRKSQSKPKLHHFRRKSQPQPQPQQQQNPSQDIDIAIIDSGTSTPTLPRHLSFSRSAPSSPPLSPSTSTANLITPWKRAGRSKPKSASSSRAQSRRGSYSRLAGTGHEAAASRDADGDERPSGRDQQQQEQGKRRSSASWKRRWSGAEGMGLGMTLTLGLGKRGGRRGSGGPSPSPGHSPVSGPRARATA